uniref:Uncharacterized protein n=1 Tax=Rhizophora mucronata TaxID=61149 RepID=A0A2P2IW78_RHIMU
MNLQAVGVTNKVKGQTTH